MAKRRSDYDSPWKEIIEQFFPQFMTFFFPLAYADIDWNQPYEFLDKELPQIRRAAKSGRHTVDKLVKVTLKDGIEAILLVHIEVQNQVDGKFTERMFIYGYRIYDRYKMRVVSLAILGDQDATWRPQEFGYDLWGYAIQLRFPIVKLLDYAADWAALEQSRNPFAVVIMAHLRAQATQRYPRTRLREKIDLIKALYAKKHTRKEVVELFRFIDWVMVLPEKYELQFEGAMKEIEEAKEMKYVTTIERRATEKGIEKGSVQAVTEVLVEALTLRFQSIPQELLVEIQKISDLTRLKALHRQAIIAQSLEEFEHFVDTSGQKAR